MARAITRRRHGRHRDFDRTRRGEDTLDFLAEQQVRLDAAEADEGIFDAMHLEQGEDSFSTFEEVQETSDPTDLGLTPAVPAFVAQTQSIDFDGSTEFFRNTTSQVIGIADVWSIGVWYKPANLTGIRSIFEINNSDSPSRIIAFFNGTTLNVFLRNSGNSINTSRTFNGFGVLDTWAHLYLSWNAAGTGFPSVFKDGSLVGQSSQSSGGNLVQADDLRPVGVGTNLSLVNKHSGLIAQMSMWRTIQDAAITSLYNGGNPNALDLNSSFGSGPSTYLGAGDLAHWWRCGHEASPNLGKDFSTAGFTPTIDVEVNSVGLTDADRVADVPT